MSSFAAHEFQIVREKKVNRIVSDIFYERADDALRRIRLIDNVQRTSVSSVFRSSNGLIRKRLSEFHVYGRKDLRFRSNVSSHINTGPFEPLKALSKRVFIFIS
ncbi:hypothetical protein NPIL_53291 [Nephila pilipes]|uniref:Uncharacterized protein n=1 Tax=Nephila pilipes TaxID=299642 RepID=A0A8X6NP32_NEPPI|nr:hypothetical protein NPIL_53291 [Nephila pilipes]